MRRVFGLGAVCALVSFPCAFAGASSPLDPSQAMAAECVGDECEAPPPAPEDPTPGTASAEGPANPPVRFPAPPRKHKHKHKHKHHHKHRSQR
jgi:hypothetical protein